MATRSQQFRSEQERSGPKRQKAVTKPKRSAVTAVNGAAKSKPAVLNISAAAKRKTGFALEESANGRPSRRSTRGGENHLKPDSNLKRRATRKVTSSESRAARSAAKTVKARGKAR